MSGTLLVGFGAIGRWLLETNQNRTTKIGCVLVRSQRMSETREILKGRAQVVSDIRELDEKPDIAIECAGHSALKMHGSAILQRGIDLGLISAGALADQGLSEKLLQSAAE
ncbi:MAG: aspartate dehydrogenase, partial [Rhodobacteraceae bacterium]|nr:aspartate dehydrogenase [Paracoccaceae bacterium]